MATDETFEYAGPAERAEGGAPVQLDGRFRRVADHPGATSEQVILEDARVEEMGAGVDREQHRYRVTRAQLDTSPASPADDQPSR